jgi:hypothetical protein
MGGVQICSVLCTVTRTMVFPQKTSANSAWANDNAHNLRNAQRNRYNGEKSVKTSTKILQDEKNRKKENLPEVGGGVGDETQDKFNGFNDLVDHQIGKAFFVCVTTVTTVTPGGLRGKMRRFVVFGVSFVVAVVQFQRCTKIVLVLLFWRKERSKNIVRSVGEVLECWSVRVLVYK